LGLPKCWQLARAGVKIRSAGKPLAALAGGGQAASVGCRETGTILEPGSWQRIGSK
jgi:hypothetical protein